MGKKDKKYNLEEILLQCLDGKVNEQGFAWLNKQIIEDPKQAEHYAEFMAIYAALREPGGISGALSTTDMEITKLNTDIPSKESILLEYIELDKKFREQKAKEEAKRQAWLKREQAEKIAEILFQKFQEEERRRQEDLLYMRERAHRSNYILAVAAVMIIAIICGVWLINNTQQKTIPSPPVPEDVAVISDAIEPQWSRPDISTRLGTQLTAGQLFLSRGFVELTFKRGAKVVLQAPVNITIRDTQHIVLNSGKLVARVPASALGFTVDTPGAYMRDLGTQFGVDVDSNGDSELHVFKGKVVLQPRKAAPGNHADKGMMVYEGQARRVDIKTDKISNISINRNAFIEHVPSAYELAVRKTDPDVYWRVNGKRGYLTDVIRSRKVQCTYTGNHLIGTGPILGDGKTAQAIVFKGDGGIYVPRLSPLIKGRKVGHSYAFWLRVDKPGKQDILIETNKGTLQYRHFGVNEKGQLELFTYFFKKGIISDKFSSQKVIQTGQWYYIVITRSATTAMRGKIALYVNAVRQVDATVHNSYMTRYMGNYYIADVPVQVRVAQWGSLHGAIAELAEYSRVLSPAEIKALYMSAQKSIPNIKRR